MGFVELPEAIGTASPIGASGRARVVSINVFAGEVIEARALKQHSVLVLDDAGRAKNIDLDVMTIELRPNDLAAVASISPKRKRAGPIVAIANLDRDQKEEFIGHEREMLRYVGGWRRDWRGNKPVWGASGWAITKAAGLGAIAWIALASILEGWAPVQPPLAETAFNLAQGGAPYILAGLALPFFTVMALLRVRSRARAQTAFLDEIWRAVGASLAFTRSLSAEPAAALPPPSASEAEWRLGSANDGLVDIDYARAV